MHKNDPSEDLPLEVAELFQRDGEWSNTRHDLFFFECDCQRTAFCQRMSGPREDTWFRHCGNADCVLLGDRPVVTVDLDSAELARRRQHARRIEIDNEKMLNEAERILQVAALRHDPGGPDSALFDEIADLLRKYVFFGREEAIITALWCAHTFCLGAAEYTPYLHLRSALPRSGKSRLLDVLEYTVARPMRFHDPTPAAIADALLFAEMFHSEPPTLLWDEVDNAYTRWTGMREIINAGFQRGTDIIRAGGKRKPTFGPKVMAGLSNLPSTVYDRCIEFDLTRAQSAEIPDRLTPVERRKLRATTGDLRIRLEAFAERNLDELMEFVVPLPQELDDRAQDICEPLLQIADIAGGDWPDKARQALIGIRHRMFSSERVSERELLLRDLRRVFGERKAMHSGAIIEALHELEDSPWRARGLSQWSMAEIVHEFSEYPGGPRIRSKRMRVGRVLRAGYLKAQFTDSWRRFLEDE